MNDLKNFNERTLPKNNELCSSLNMKVITDADYMHGKRVFIYFGIKNLGEYHDLYLKSDTSLVFNVFGWCVQKL